MRIRGAREHNLDGVDLDLPERALIVLTGVSGSGKSSLAFDTIYREGQRLFLESMSSHARQFLGKLCRPDVDTLTGLRPALAVEQKTTVRSPRSTVGTLSETYDHLRLLFARIGKAQCTECGAALRAHSPDQLTDILRERFGDSPITLLAPIVQDHRGAYRAELEDAVAQGFERARIDAQLVSLIPTPNLDPQTRHSIDLLVAATNTERPGFGEVLRKTLRHGKNQVRILHAGGIDSYGTSHACGACGAGAERLSPRLFSFNSHHGACKNCKGLGVQDRVAPELLVADANKTLRTGAMVPTTKSEYIVYSQVTMDVLNEVCQAHGFDVDTPWNQLADAHRQVVFYGSDKLEVPFGKHTLESRMKWSGITARPRDTGYYRGLIPVIEETLKRNRNANILRFVRSEPCTGCAGTRMSPAARAVTIAGKSITDLAQLTLDDLAQALSELSLDGCDRKLADPVLESLQPRIDRLVQLGLGHLSLARESTTLSGGEAQRIRLATQVGSGLHGLLYVLDEPSIGLHPRDQQRMIETLQALRDAGNDVLVVEHDEATMRAADWLVDIGPAAGEHGGRVLFSGHPSTIANAPRESRTRAALASDPPREKVRRAGLGRMRIHGARYNNLKGDLASFRLRALNVVSGVSGAGKSSLVLGVLATAVRHSLHGANETPGAHEKIEGAAEIDKLVSIDQDPIGRTPRSNPATYTGVFDAIRALFATLPSAIERGLGRGDFSTNVKGGRCEACMGAGVQVVGMHGLADVSILCDVCEGQRFVGAVLEVQFEGKTIADVLDLSIEDAIRLFSSQAKILRTLERMAELGLGYLRLGQPAPTLSGGEAQRVKLAAELARPAGTHTLYILDEPTTGLHAADVSILLAALDKLVEAGHTVVVIEHALEVLNWADHIVDMGPDSGAHGGQVVAEGTPEHLAQQATHTGRALADFLRGHTSSPKTGTAEQVDVKPPPAIELRGVTTHNLRDIDVTIPHEALTVVTGVSGSGKSSLCFDSLFAEGQRRFAECLSNQVRRFLGRTGRAELREARGLTPTVAIRQRGRSHDRRSTLGTTTGILELYRLLFSRAGRVDGERTELSLRAFSFLHQQGACPSCEGLGIGLRCDPEKLITHPHRSLQDGAMDGTKTGRFYGETKGQYTATLICVGKVHAIDFAQPWSSLKAKARSIAMHGTDHEEYNVVWSFERGKRSGEHSFKTTWLGFAGLVDEEYQRKRSDHRGEAMRPLLGEHLCPACAGTRLAATARAVRVQGKSLPELCAETVDASTAWLNQVAKTASKEDLSLTKPIRDSVIERLAALQNAGLGYLSVDRRTHTLSGGEFQRARIAAQLSTTLKGITYVLDEPTQGLHADDTQRLLKVLKQLCQQGNTVVVVEHDRSVIEAADHVIDMGPGAGEDGGRVLAAGTIDDLRNNPESKTGRHLASPPTLRKSGSRPETGRIRLRAAACHGIAFGDIELPTGGLCVVSGPSGSGKSTLIFDILAASAERGQPVHCEAISGLDTFMETLTVDQSPAGQTATSTPATYTGVFDAIRSVFAKTDAAKSRGLSKARFSYLSKGSRCESCGGLGRTVTRMDFLPDLVLTCDRCQGQRYEEGILEVSLRGRTIADVLQMSIHEAREFFAHEPKIMQILATLDDLGLGYLRLGQASNTLSGGESQRLILARALVTPSKAPCLFLLDEPTTGLHFDDIDTLFALFDTLIERGHSLIIIEHHPDVIARADWNIPIASPLTTR